VVRPAVARDNGLFTSSKPKTDVSGIPGLLTLRSNGPAGAVGALYPTARRWIGLFHAQTLCGLTNDGTQRSKGGAPAPISIAFELSLC